MINFCVLTLQSQLKVKIKVNNAKMPHEQSQGLSDVCLNRVSWRHRTPFMGIANGTDGNDESIWLSPETVSPAE